MERIAQMVFIRVEHPEFEIVEEFQNTERGDKGFCQNSVKDLMNSTKEV